MKAVQSSSTQDQYIQPNLKVCKYIADENEKKINS